MTGAAALTLVFLVGASSQPAPEAPPDEAPASQPDDAAAGSQPAAVLVDDGAEEPDAQPEEKPLRTREDILPWTAFAAGLGAALTGVLVTGVGVFPVLSMLRAYAVLAEVNARDFQEGDQSLIAMREAELYDRNRLFLQAGAPIMGAGLGLIVLGGLMVAGGFYTGVRLTAGE